MVIVDVVTDRVGGLHNELLKRLDPAALPIASDLYAAAYHSVERDGQPALDVWQYGLDLGGPLRTMPLYLTGGLCLPVDLDRSYQRTCLEPRIPVFA